MASLTRDGLSRLPRRLLSPGRNRTKAEVLLIEWEGAPVVAKDFRARSVLVRNSIGRFSIARECRAYARLAGLAGIPRLVGRIDAHAFAYAFVAGTPLPQHERRSVPPPFLRALETLLAAVHARGVAIADLHHRNVIVQELSREPALIDFSLAMVQPSRWNLPGRWIFRQAQQLDRLALARITARYEAPVEASPSDAPLRSDRAHGLDATSPSGRVDLLDTLSPAGRAAGSNATSRSGRADRLDAPARSGRVDRSGAPRDSTMPAPSPTSGFPLLYVLGRSLKGALRRLRGRA